MTTIENFGEKHDKLNDSSDEFLEEREPSAPFALVGLSYLVILAVVAFALGAYLLFL